MSSLIPCSACRRHVRDDEVDCPFCAAPLTARAPSVARPPLTGEKRSTLFAMSMSLAASACGADIAESAVPIYGAPVPPLSQGGSAGARGIGGSGIGGSGIGGSGISFGGTGNAVPVYGAPVPPSQGGSSSGGAGGGPIDGGSSEVRDAGPVLDAAAADADVPP